uniref:Uncharacterized protein n=1 Tax=Clastoptera arizonana TaxID=38151 RepID=A0A1B6CB68_9HEMI
MDVLRELNNLLNHEDLHDDNFFEKTLDYLLQRFINFKDLDIIKIIEWVKLQDKAIPLELVWVFQKTNFLHFSTYICQNPRIISAIGTSFRYLIWGDRIGNKERHAIVVKDLLAELVNFENYSQRCNYKLCQQLLHYVVKQVIDKIKEDENVHSPLNYLDGLFHTSNVVGSKLRSFCILHLRMLIQQDQDVVSLTDAVQYQAKSYTSNKISSVFRNFFRQIFQFISLDDTIAEYQRIVEMQLFNWKWFLVSISIMIFTRPESASVMRKVIENWLNTACITENSCLLSIALLSARQCCAENSDLFGSYSSWFGGIQIQSSLGFNFFMQNLSHLVPLEPALYLKIHINKVPTPPSHCLSTLSDYVTLAKTRLDDLNETTDYMGLFNEYVSTEQEGREEDISKVVQYYAEHGEILKTVLEASVFRRQFYEKVFLPELLKVSESSDFARGKLIRKLHSIGKIPVNLFKQWIEIN